MANALSYYGLESEFAFVKHDDGVEDYDGPVSLVVWKRWRLEGGCHVVGLRYRLWCGVVWCRERWEVMWSKVASAVASTLSVASRS